MPISNKLSHLADTKEQIRQAIISKGVPVSESDTFQSYSDKISLIEGGGGVAPVSARFWRLSRISSPNSSWVGLMGVLFDGEFPSAGSPVFSSQHINNTADFSASNAFQDNDDMWSTASGAIEGAYIGWDFVDPVSFQFITVRSANTSARAEYVPVEFSVETSDDGTDWSLLKVFSTDAWLQDQSRIFSLH